MTPAALTMVILAKSLFGALGEDSFSSQSAVRSRAIKSSMALGNIPTEKVGYFLDRERFFVVFVISR
jgi:hypothetical protein